jgi:hypothetical protein
MFDYIYIPKRYRNGITGESQPDGFNDEQCTAIVLNSIHNEKNWNDVPCVAMGIHYFLCEKVNNKTGTNITMFLPVARQHAGKYPYVDQIVKIVYDII